MARTVTDNKGEFIISGMNEERTRLDGVVKIYHDCDDYLVKKKKKKNICFISIENQRIKLFWRNR